MENPEVKGEKIKTKNRKVRKIPKKVIIDKPRVECSVLIYNSVRMYLLKKLKEFQRGESEMGTFAGLTIYFLLKERNTEMDYALLNYYYDEVGEFQKKYNLSNRHAVTDALKKSAHLDYVRFSVIDELNSQIKDYAEELNTLSFSRNHPINKISKSALILCLLCYARDNNLPIRREVNYIPVVKDTGLNELLIKDVMEKM